VGPRASLHEPCLPTAPVSELGGCAGGFGESGAGARGAVLHRTWRTPPPRRRPATCRPRGRWARPPRGAHARRRCLRSPPPALPSVHTRQATPLRVRWACTLQDHAGRQQRDAHARGRGCRLRPAPAQRTCPSTTCTRPPSVASPSQHLDHPQTTLRPPSDHPQTTLRPPSDHPQTTLRPPSDHPQTTHTPPSDHPQTTLRPPSDHPQTTLRPPSDHPHHLAHLACAHTGAGRRASGSAQSSPSAQTLSLSLSFSLSVCAAGGEGSTHRATRARSAAMSARSTLSLAASHRGETKATWWWCVTRGNARSQSSVCCGARPAACPHPSVNRVSWGKVSGAPRSLVAPQRWGTRRALNVHPASS
jgi:hypothetical protein